MHANQAIEGALVSAGLLCGRLLLALIFVHEGWSIIGTYSGAAAPRILLPAVIALEPGDGLLIATGLLTRVFAPAFAVFCLLTAVLFHWQFTDGNQLLHFEKDLAIAGGFLVLAISGPGNGPWNDAWRRIGSRRDAASWHHNDVPPRSTHDCWSAPS